MCLIGTLSANSTSGVTRCAADVGPTNDSAIIIIDFQNEFGRANGRLHEDVKAVKEETGMLQKISHVVRAVR